MRQEMLSKCNGGTKGDDSLKSGNNGFCEKRGGKEERKPRSFCFELVRAKKSAIFCLRSRARGLCVTFVKEN